MRKRESSASPRMVSGNRGMNWTSMKIVEKLAESRKGTNSAFRGRGNGAEERHEIVLSRIRVIHRSMGLKPNLIALSVNYINAKFGITLALRSKNTSVERNSKPRWNIMEYNANRVQKQYHISKNGLLGDSNRRLAQVGFSSCFPTAHIFARSTPYGTPCCVEPRNALLVFTFL